MLKEEKKILRVVDSLNAYCLFVGAKTFSIKIENQKKCWRIFVESDFKKKNLESILDFEKRINEIDCKDTEEMFWTMIGSVEFEDDNDIDVVGCMIDCEEMVVENNRFRATFKRNKE